MARTMTVALGPHYEEFIQSAIASGRYNNASEVVRSALRRLEDGEVRLASLLFRFYLDKLQLGII